MLHTDPWFKTCPHFGRYCSQKQKTYSSRSPVLTTNLNCATHAYSVRQPHHSASASPCRETPPATATTFALATTLFSQPDECLPCNTLALQETSDKELKKVVFPLPLPKLSTEGRSAKLEDGGQAAKSRKKTAKLREVKHPNDRTCTTLRMLRAYIRRLLPHRS